MDETTLAAILEEGSVEKCVAFFRGMPEKQRRALAPICAKWFKKTRKEEFIQTSPNTYEANPLVPVDQYAPGSFTPAYKSVAITVEPRRS